MHRILVLFPNDFDRRFLTRERFPEYEFYFEGEDTLPPGVSALGYIDRLIERYKDKGLSGVISTQDFPGVMLASVLCKHWGLPGCTLISSLRLQHKYYSRLEQRRLLPERTPAFDCIPATGPLDAPAIAYPFFIKPVKAVFSFLAARIENEQELGAFLTNSRETLAAFIEPFNEVLMRYTDFEIDGNHYIAEELLEGEQVTLDGYCWDHEVYIIGIVDSVKYPGTNSFHSFEYPSKLPEAVQQRMIDLAKRFIGGTDFDHAMFNIEMFYDAARDRIDIIEVNPRMFFAAADYYEKVDGLDTYAAHLELARGIRPRLTRRTGRFGVAATFTPRVFEDRRVVRMPDESEIRQLQEAFPDMILRLEHRVGDKLSDRLQSSGSYRYATINLGGRDWEDLYSRYDRLKQALNIELAELAEER